MTLESLQLHNHVLDLCALMFFIMCWTLYAWYADRPGHTRNTLLDVTNTYRLEWMRQMLKREVRTLDSIMVGNLLRSITFFANTTIFILLGLMTLLGYSDRAMDIVNDLPLVQPAEGFWWQVRVLLLIVIFIFAYFKYTWSLRQYNYAGIFIAACPAYNDRVDEHDEYAKRGARLVSNAARHFNNGLRAYYFGLAALGWFIHPYVFIGATALVVYVTHRREYKSITLATLSPLDT